MEKQKKAWKRPSRSQLGWIIVAAALIGIADILISLGFYTPGRFSAGECLAHTEHGFTLQVKSFSRMTNDYRVTVVKAASNEPSLSMVSNISTISTVPDVFKLGAELLLPLASLEEDKTYAATQCP